MDILDKFDELNSKKNGEMDKFKEEEKKRELSRTRGLIRVMSELVKLRNRGFSVELDNQEGVKDKCYPFPNINIKGNGKSLSVAMNNNGDHWLVGPRRREFRDLHTEEELYRYVVEQITER